MSKLPVIAILVPREQCTIKAFCGRRLVGQVRVQKRSDTSMVLVGQSVSRVAPIESPVIRNVPRMYLARPTYESLFSLPTMAVFTRGVGIVTGVRCCRVYHARVHAASR